MDFLRHRLSLKRNERHHYLPGSKRRQWALVQDISLVAGIAALLALIAYKPLTAVRIESPWEAVRHLASSPNCSAARLVGLAPAFRGQPGYWSSHDADKDGIACEPWPPRAAK
ncbi:excalibur calcium-binding domain-containing protein [Mesorhizobium sp. 1B3]|uniref:excalibur calcium-binding domain-containing protein n=1 Tax=Mesorhizobium sp. 1B3 TaxID=3243599 RepID=UPI003D97B315